jgi:hypothetical protein
VISSCAASLRDAFDIVSRRVDSETAQGTEIRIGSGRIHGTARRDILGGDSADKIERDGTSRDVALHGMPL